MSSSPESNDPTAPTGSTPAPSSGSWKLPDGIEDHLEQGVLKAAVGAAVGGALGMLLFRSGKGWRSASVASGLGVALGSTYARVMNGSNSSTTVQLPYSNVQTFQTEPPPLRKEKSAAAASSKES